MILSSRRRRASVTLILVAGLAAACGDVRLSAAPERTVGPSASAAARPTLGPTASPPPKLLPPADQVVLAGWIGDSPMLASFAKPGEPWAVGSWSPAGWTSAGVLPAGSRPVSDGVSIANVVDPEVATAIAILRDGRTAQIALPSAPWLPGWQGTGHLDPLPGGGYLLRGATALATVSPEGRLTAEPLPAGFVALAPTSAAGTWLLATTKDAAEPGALSESTPFSVYLWSDSDPAEPVRVLEEVTLIAPSATGLAMLRRGDGSWWELGVDGRAAKRSDPTRASTVIDPSGAWLATLDAGAGCDIMTTQACPVSVGPTGGGSLVTEPGPAAGLAFAGGRIAAVLSRRTGLHLPWRLLAGPADNPVVVPLQ